jgi:hypothetical protein
MVGDDKSKERGPLTILCTGVGTALLSAPTQFLNSLHCMRMLQTSCYPCRKVRHVSIKSVIRTPTQIPISPLNLPLFPVLPALPLLCPPPPSPSIPLIQSSSIHSTSSFLLDHRASSYILKSLTSTLPSP